MTTFKSSLAICGLSQSEAAEFLGVSLQSVKNWGRGKGSPPFGVWVMLADRFKSILDAGEMAADSIDPESMDRLQLNHVTADDGLDPMPDSATHAAGAVAVLTAICNRNL